MDVLKVGLGQEKLGGGGQRQQINNTLELEDERGSEVIMWYLGDINI